MPQLLQMIGRLLEARRAVLTADDVDSIDETTRRFLLEQRVLVRSDNAEYVVCDACHEDHVEPVQRVVGHDGSVRFEIYCPHAGLVEVASRRIQQWRVDPARVANLLSDCVEPGRSADGVIPNNAWWIGTVGICGGTYNVYFVRNGLRDAEAAVERIARQGEPGRSILVGTRPWEDGSGQFALATDLQSAFSWDGNALSLQTSRLAAGLPVDLYTGHMFVLKGDNYRIRFDGKEISPKKSVGLFYIACLLQKRPEAISSVELQAIRNGQSQLVMAGSSGEVIDRDGLRHLKGRLDELAGEIEAARENHDDSLLFRLQTEQEQILAEVRKATGIGGRTRDQSDASKARKAVYRAIKGAIKKVAKEHPALGTHLDQYVKTGKDCRYTLDRDEINWLV